MRLGADHQRMQTGIRARVQPLFDKHVVEPTEIARNGMCHGGSKIPHELDLARTVTRTGRNRQTAESLDAILETQSPRE